MNKLSKHFSFLHYQISYPKGQTLIETLAAIAIIGIVITAIGVVVTTSLSNAKYDENETLSTKYAQQGSELIEQIRDDNYTNFQNFNGIYCLAKNQTTLSSPANCTTPNVDNFIRSVNIQQNGCGANITQVTVVVSFTDGKCSSGVYCHKQTEQTCLSTANPVIRP